MDKNESLLENCLHEKWNAAPIYIILSAPNSAASKPTLYKFAFPLSKHLFH